MTGEQLFESLQYLDDTIVEEAAPRRTVRRVWLRWTVAAACMLLVAGAALALPRLKSTQTPAAGAGEVFWTPLPQDAASSPQPGGVPGPEAESGAPKPAVLAWNDVEGAAGTSGADVAGVMQVAEPLTKAQLAACAPEIRLEWMDDFTGFASYYLAGGAGGLAQIEMKVTHPGVGQYTVCLRDVDAPEIPDCIARPQPETEKVGSLDGLEYRAYRLHYLHGEGDPELHPPEAWTEMQVVFEKEGVVYTLTAAVPQTLEEAAAVDLKDLLLAYAGTHSVPDLGAFRCGEYLYRDDTLTLDEALSDPDFGAYLPAEGPEGFDFDFARRYQFEEAANYLMAFWTQGRADLQWLVLPSEAEAPDSPEIPVETLTEEVIEALTVTDYDGLPCCRFRVCYAGTAVRIIARGVSAQWLCKALTQIRQ